MPVNQRTCLLGVISLLCMFPATSAAAAAAAAAATTSSNVIALQDHSQLLLDDRLIDQSTRLKRTVHQPEVDSRNPLLTAEKPWEGTCVTLWGTVLYDEQ